MKIARLGKPHLFQITILKKHIQEILKIGKIFLNLNTLNQTIIKLFTPPL